MKEIILHNAERVHRLLGSLISNGLIPDAAKESISDAQECVCIIEGCVELMASREATSDS